MHAEVHSYSALFFFFFLLCTFVSSFFIPVIFFPLTGGLDEPIQRPYVERDWRFGHYEMEGLQDPLCRLWRFMTRPATATLNFRKRKPQMNEEDEALLAIQ